MRYGNDRAHIDHTLLGPDRVSEGRKALHRIWRGAPARLPGHPGSGRRVRVGGREDRPNLQYLTISPEAAAPGHYK